MNIIKLSTLSVALLASTAALAAEPYAYNEDAGIIRNTTGAVVGTTKTLFHTVTHPAAISAEVGTLGYGANVAFGINEKTELQAGWAGGDVADLFGGDFDANDVNYEVDSKFSNPYMGVQLRPAGNWFTMGAGIIVPDNTLDVRANPNGGVYKVNGTQYNANDVGVLEGSVDHRNKLAPYGTIGFRPNINNKFGVFGEVGAAYMGKTDANIRSVGGVANVRDQAGNPTGQSSSDVAAIAQNELENKNYLEWLPIVKLGATYRF